MKDKFIKHRVTAHDMVRYRALVKARKAEGHKEKTLSAIIRAHLRKLCGKYGV